MALPADGGGYSGRGDVSACIAAVDIVLMIVCLSSPLFKMATEFNIENTACVKTRTSGSESSGRSGETTEIHSSA